PDAMYQQLMASDSKGRFLHVHQARVSVITRLNPRRREIESSACARYDRRYRDGIARPQLTSEAHPHPPGCAGVLRKAVVSGCSQRRRTVCQATSGTDPLTTSRSDPG